MLNRKLDGICRIMQQTAIRNMLRVRNARYIKSFRNPLHSPLPPTPVDHNNLTRFKLRKTEHSTQIALRNALQLKNFTHSLKNENAISSQRNL